MKRLVGQTIKVVYLNRFYAGRAMGYRWAFDPVIEFEDGTFLRFMVQPTEDDFGGVKLIYPARPQKLCTPNKGNL